MSAADRYRAAVMEHDSARAALELADDIEMYNPFAVEPLVGRETVAKVLGSLGSSFDEFVHVRVLTAPGEPGSAVAETQAVMFSARLGDQVIEGLDVFEVNREDKISKFTVYARPLPALQALGQAMARNRPPGAGPA